MVALKAKLKMRGCDKGGNMPQCSMPPQLSIHWKCLKETPWVSKDALLANQNDQVDYEHSLTTHLTKTRGLTKCHNESDASNSKCSVEGIHRHLKRVIH